MSGPARSAAWRPRPRLASVAAALATAVVALLAGTPSPAPAAWGPAQILSATSAQQGEAADAPALSHDGRFVVFEGSYAGTSGVWRKSLAGGALELVAADAVTPSVSADGSLVAFATTVALDTAHDRNALSDVYLRDMRVPAEEPGAYRLVSAVDGGDDALAYAGGSGAALAQRGALSADGSAVVFTVLSDSNLADGGATPTTPAGQVALRRLDTRSTTLVSTVYDRGADRQTSDPVPGGTMRAPLGSTATISADGTTVAWFAINVELQTRVVAKEYAATGADLYNEPLWRRVADGPQAPIRRVTGGGDPFNPACPPDGTIPVDLGQPVAEGANPCQGPFAVTRIGGGAVSGTLTNVGKAPAAPDPTPQLSADGWSVALLASAPLRDTDTMPVEASPTANAYVVDMRPGLTRWQALRPLTAWASVAFGDSPLLTANVSTIAISPDGTHVALTTARGPFPLSPPLLLDPQLPRAGTAELYDVDLRAGTIRRATRAYGGGQLASVQLVDGAYLPSYSADDRRIAFASNATNLVYGDGNGASDVYAVDWADPPRGPGPPLGTVSPAPPGVTTRPLWRLGVTARSRRDGRVAVEVVVPAAGTVSLRAIAAVRARTRSKLRIRRVTAASRRGVSGTAGLVVLPLTARRSLLPAVRSRSGLAARVVVTFVPRAGRRLRATLPVRFRAAAKQAVKRRAAVTPSGQDTRRGGSR